MLEIVLYQCQKNKVWDNVFQLNTSNTNPIWYFLLNNSTVLGVTILASTESFSEPLVRQETIVKRLEIEQG